MALWGKVERSGEPQFRRPRRPRDEFRNAGAARLGRRPRPALHLHCRRVPLPYRGPPLGWHRHAGRSARQTRGDPARFVGSVFPRLHAAHRRPHVCGRHSRAVHGAYRDAALPGARMRCAPARSMPSRCGSRSRSARRLRLAPMRSSSPIRRSTRKNSICAPRRPISTIRELRQRIVAFVRALITAAQRLKDDPQIRLAAGRADCEARYRHRQRRVAALQLPGHARNRSARRFERQEPWIAKIQSRAPRARADAGEAHRRQRVARSAGD